MGETLDYSKIAMDEALKKLPKNEIPTSADKNNLIEDNKPQASFDTNDLGETDQVKKQKIQPIGETNSLQDLEDSATVAAVRALEDKLSSLSRNDEDKKGGGSAAGAATATLEIDGGGGPGGNGRGGAGAHMEKAPIKIDR